MACWSHPRLIVRPHLIWCHLTDFHGLEADDSHRDDIDMDDKLSFLNHLLTRARETVVTDLTSSGDEVGRSVVAPSDGD